MKKKVALLGSTGSIGQNAIEIVKQNSDEYEIVALSAFTNVDRLVSQSRDLKPKYANIVDLSKADTLKNAGLKECTCTIGPEGLLQLIIESGADIVLNSIVGAAGLMPTVTAIRSGISVALANKESLVVAGELVMRETRKHEVDLLPIDSEHSAIWQCLKGETLDDIKRIILTASGGPFLRRDLDSFQDISVDEALNHPNWEMGNKITIDSATLMNKGFEVIETHWFFETPPEKIEVVIHPQSIVHSMVEFIDGSVKAQLGVPDMKLPIQYALTYPERRPGRIDNESIFLKGNLTFEKPDLKRYPCLSLAFEAMKAGGTAPAVLNAANEVAVHMFLKKQVPFSAISELIESTLEQHSIIRSPELDDYLNADSWARCITEKKAEQYVF